MISFVIIEVDDGLTIVQLTPNQSAEDAALAQGGVLVDAGPFSSYEDAYDALTELEGEEAEEERY